MRYFRFTSLALLLLLLTGCSTFAPWRDQSFVEQHVTFIAIHKSGFLDSLDRSLRLTSENVAATDDWFINEVVEGPRRLSGQARAIGQTVLRDTQRTQQNALYIPGPDGSNKALR